MSIGAHGGKEHQITTPTWGNRTRHPRYEGAHKPDHVSHNLVKYIRHIPHHVSHNLDKYITLDIGIKFSIDSLLKDYFF